MKDADGLVRTNAIAYFNLQRNKGHKVKYTNSILYDPKDNLTDNLYLRNAVNSMVITPDWYEKLGLNLNDLMNMDHGNYRLIDKLLKSHREVEKRKLAEMKKAQEGNDKL